MRYLIALLFIVAPLMAAPAPTVGTNAFRVVINVTARPFLAVADDGIDDTAAFQAASDAMVAGQVLLIPKGTFHITNWTFDPPDGCGILWDGTVYSSASNSVVTIGTESDIRQYYDIRGIMLLNTNDLATSWTSNKVGIDIVNVNHSDIGFRQVWQFKTNVLLRGYTYGNAYNTYNLGQLWGGTNNLVLTASNGGYINENVFIGGSLGWPTATFPSLSTNLTGLLIDHVPAHQINSHKFYGLSIESTGATQTNVVALKCEGWNNRFDGVRVEGPGYVHFTSNVLRKNIFNPAYMTFATVVQDDTGKNELHLDNQTYVYGAPGDLPAFTIRNGSSDSYPALGVASADGTATNFYAYGSGNVRGRTFQAFGTSGQNGFLGGDGTNYFVHIMPLAEDDVSVAFGAYYLPGSAWRSQDAESQFRIFNSSEKLWFQVSAGNAVGNAVTWTNVARIGENGVWSFVAGGVVFDVPGYHTADTVPYLDASKALRSSAVTPTELGYLITVQTNIATSITAIVNALATKITKTSGTTNMTGGTVVVTAPEVTANSRIFLTAQTADATSGAIGVSARSAGASFTILSTSGTDTNTVAWMLFEP